MNNFVTAHKIESFYRAKKGVIVHCWGRDKKSCPERFIKPTKNKGIEDILDIDSHCPYLLFGETTSHLTSK